MGWIKDAKAEAIGKEAQRALDEGRAVFVCRINQGTLQSNFSGPLSGVAEQIEAIEALGWELEQASFSHDHKDHASAFLIFRKARPATPPGQRQAVWGGQ
ncbi:hypothetical protein [Streptomyces xanthochromogenes]|uniref:Uncharacterized protein n=1 Tax=Streptomyces xanthochromogenes TaxID=67384 RepID=A0ABQ3AYW6_9ACTN|nr:hypothetical protein [Streptomyces xanthochromogenes]GGY72096.1 hypothetical protein GCM10010326_77860 [Streptomyces xanthochromogenes]